MPELICNGGGMPTHLVLKQQLEVEDLRLVPHLHTGAMFQATPWI